VIFEKDSVEALSARMSSKEANFEGSEASHPKLRSFVRKRNRLALSLDRFVCKGKMPLCSTLKARVESSAGFPESRCRLDFESI
jgi:hypothetical protein